MEQHTYKPTSLTDQQVQDQILDQILDTIGRPSTSSDANFTPATSSAHALDSPATSSAHALDSPALPGENAPDSPATSTPSPPPDSRPDPGAKLLLQLKKRHGIYQDRELAECLRALPAAGYLVDGLLQPCSVNILVGDSGIGKSALVYQLALAVAAGKPFLGHSCRPGKVVLVDYENSLWDSHRILQQQRKHLGLDEAPDTLQIWPMNKQDHSATRGQLAEEGLHENVEEVIDAFAAGLVVFDSLRSFNPAMESDNATAAKQIKQLRAIAQSKGTAILLVHHVRKHGQNRSGPLEDGAPLDWLIRSAGSRALINQTDARLAIAMRKKNDDTLILRGHLRTHGEVGPYLLSRVWDQVGEPLGYQRFEATPQMLENPEQEATFQKLPAAFCFTQALQLYGKQNHAVSLFLQKLIRLGLARKTGHGQYQKSDPSPYANGEFYQEVDIISAA
jgi:KaiC/GvpD/RAD55 family RecA-like ATPase